MCGPPGEPPRHGNFDRDVKCCSYHPDLPNYLVGGVLQDASARRDDMAAAIARGIGVSPLGLAQPPASAAVYREAAAAFGTAHALRCPWYVPGGANASSTAESAAEPAASAAAITSGQCGIWRHRPAVCATYFCKFERGAVSQAFWTATKALLLELELEVSLWCATQLDATGGLPNHRGRAQGGISTADLDGGTDDASRRAQWGNWFGREAEFFVRCAELVATLGIDDVLVLAGPRLRVLADRLQAAHAALSSRVLPERLALAPMVVQSEAPGRIRVATYLSSDPLVMPVTLGTALLGFHGQTVAEANAELARTQGITLGAGLLQRLVDFRVLVPPATLSQPAPSQPTPSQPTGVQVATDDSPGD